MTQPDQSQEQSVFQSQRVTASRPGGSLEGLGLAFAVSRLLAMALVSGDEIFVQIVKLFQTQPGEDRAVFRVLAQ